MTETTRKLIEETLHSKQAVTFLDALSILRSIRSSGLTTRHFQNSLIELLEHPEATRRSVEILEKALTAELKNHERELLRGRRPLSERNNRQTVHGVCGQELRVELPASSGSYWEPTSNQQQAIEIRLLLGEAAKAGCESFGVSLKAVGRYKVCWERRLDAREASKSSLRNRLSDEFYLEIVINNHP